MLHYQIKDWSTQIHSVVNAYCSGVAEIVNVSSNYEDMNQTKNSRRAVSLILLPQTSYCTELQKWQLNPFSTDNLQFLASSISISEDFLTLKFLSFVKHWLITNSYAIYQNVVRNVATLFCIGHKSSQLLHTLRSTSIHIHVKDKLNASRGDLLIIGVICQIHSTD